MLIVANSCNISRIKTEPGVRLTAQHSRTCPDVRGAFITGRIEKNWVDIWAMLTFSVNTGAFPHKCWACRVCHYYLYKCLTYMHNTCLQAKLKNKPPRFNRGGFTHAVAGSVIAPGTQPRIRST